jgi:hypothetical protein
MRRSKAAVPNVKTTLREHVNEGISKRAREHGVVQGIKRVVPKQKHVRTRAEHGSETKRPNEARTDIAT